MAGNTKLSTELGETHSSTRNSFKDSYVLEFPALPKDHDEKELQKGLIGQMKNFILELGKDFLFVGGEYRIQVGKNDFFIDLLFYHISQGITVFGGNLKADKFKPGQLRQLNFYPEALGRDAKKPDENPGTGSCCVRTKTVIGIPPCLWQLYKSYDYVISLSKMDFIAMQDGLHNKIVPLDSLYLCSRFAT